jgi:hypothetical protein
VCAKELVADSRLLSSWKALNYTEQYFALLVAWLVHARPEIIGARSREGSYATQLVRLTERLSSDLTVLDPERFGLLYSAEDKMIVALMELFGWIEIEYSPAEKGKGPQIHSIQWLPLGHAMVELINHYWLNCELFASTGELCGNENALLAYFVATRPELVSVLPPDEKIEHSGTFVWRVSVGPVWRRIEIGSTSTLEALAEAILTAYDFDNEHLYCFEMIDPRGRQLRFDHPFCESHNRMVHETELGQLPLPYGSTVTFWYDFGDDWKFELLLEAVRDAPPLPAPIVTCRRGKSPQQYSYDNDWD